MDALDSAAYSVGDFSYEMQVYQLFYLGRGLQYHSCLFDHLKCPNRRLPLLIKSPHAYFYLLYTSALLDSVHQSALAPSRSSSSPKEQFYFSTRHLDHCSQA